MADFNLNSLYARPKTSASTVTRMPEAGTAAGNVAAASKQLGQLGSGYAYNAGTNSYTNANGGGATIDQNGRVVPIGHSQTGPNSYMQAGGQLTSGAADPTDQALDALRKMSAGSGTFGGGAGGAVNTSPMSLPGEVSLRSVAGMGPADAAQNASFGKAKATAGALGRSSLDTLRANLAERGLLGGGTEARGLVSRLAEATNPLSDLNTAALHENVDIAQHNQDLDAQAASTEYGGKVAQRGQTINGQLTARGQDIQTQTANANRNQQALQGLVSMFSKSLY